MTIPRTGNVWHSPYNVYRHLHRLARNVGQDAIEKDGKYKPVREARLAAVTALVISKMTNNFAYVQLPEADPPDAYLMQLSKKKKGQLDITTLEITSYRSNAGESLLEQLRRTKVGAIQKYSDEYILVVELLSKEGIDYEAIRDYLNSIKISFPIWTLYGKTVDASTTAELTIINPQIKSTEINIAEEGFKQKEQGMIEVLRIRRTGSENNVRIESNGVSYELPPWEGKI